MAVVQINTTTPPMPKHNVYASRNIETGRVHICSAEDIYDFWSCEWLCVPATVIPLTYLGVTCEQEIQYLRDIEDESRLEDGTDALHESLVAIGDRDFCPKCRGQWFCKDCREEERLTALEYKADLAKLAATRARIATITAAASANWPVIIAPPELPVLIRAPYDGVRQDETNGGFPVAADAGACAGAGV